MSPTARSLKLLRERGYFCQVVEKWNAFARIRQDLFGFIDVLAMKGNELLAVQSTSDGNVLARVHKILSSPLAPVWLESASRRLVVQGWAKRGLRGKRKKWECREVEIFKEDFDEPKKHESHTVNRGDEQSANCERAASDELADTVPS